MRIAVTYDNGSVFQHFGKTGEFKLYDVEDKQIISSEILSCGDTGHEALAGLLAENGVEVVICGGLGGGAQAALSEAGIDVFSGAKGEADQAVEKYLKGELVSDGVNCDHHEHEHAEETHEEGCSCGDDCGCGSDDEEGGCGGCGGGCGGCGHREMQIIYDGKNAGKICRVHYTGTFDDGSKFDSSFDRGQPLEFLCGVGMMIEGFDKAVVDMEIGDEIDIHLMPEQAYGQKNPNAIIKSPIKEIPGSENLNVGEELYLQADDGHPFPVVVTEKTDSDIVFDANHKLAGKELNFHIQLLAAQ